MLSIRWTRPGTRRDTEAVPTVPAASPGAGRPSAGRGTGARRPGAVEAAQDAAQPATTTPPAVPAPTAAPTPPATPPPHSARKRTHRAARRRRSVLVRFDEAEYAAIAAAGNRADLSPTAYVGVAALKLAAKALAGGEVSAAELAAAAEAASRSVARVEAAAALVHRRLA